MRRVPSFGFPDKDQQSATQAYMERDVFSVCGQLTADKRNWLSRGLEKRILLILNMKYYEMM